jgi:hypothetical protein
MIAHHQGAVDMSEVLIRQGVTRKWWRWRGGRSTSSAARSLILKLCRVARRCLPLPRRPVRRVRLRRRHPLPHVGSGPSWCRESASGAERGSESYPRSPASGARRSCSARAYPDARTDLRAGASRRGTLLIHSIRVGGGRDTGRRSVRTQAPSSPISCERSVARPDGLMAAGSVRLLSWARWVRSIAAESRACLHIPLGQALGPVFTNSGALSMVR